MLVSKVFTTKNLSSGYTLCVNSLFSNGSIVMKLVHSYSVDGAIKWNNPLEGNGQHLPFEKYTFSNTGYLEMYHTDTQAYI